MKRGFVLLLLLILITNVSAYEIFYYHSDHLGSPVAITNQEGNVIWSADYKPFGESFNEVGENNYKYNSKELDDSGLLYYGARYYDAGLGRFISADTIKGDIQRPQTLNRYVYVKNNPMKYTDPTGNQEEFIDDYLAQRQKYQQNVEGVLEVFETTGDVLEEAGRFASTPLDVASAVGNQEPWWSVALASIPFVGRLHKGYEISRSFSLTKRVFSIPTSLGSRRIEFSEAGLEHMLERHAMPMSGKQASLFVKKVDDKIVMQTEEEIHTKIVMALSDLKSAKTTKETNEAWINEKLNLRIITEKNTGEFINAYPYRRFDEFSNIEWRKISRGEYDVVNGELILK